VLCSNRSIPKQHVSICMTEAHQQARAAMLQLFEEGVCGPWGGGGGGWADTACGSCTILQASPGYFVRFNKAGRFSSTYHPLDDPVLNITCCAAAAAAAAAVLGMEPVVCHAQRCSWHQAHPRLTAGSREQQAQGQVCVHPQQNKVLIAPGWGFEAFAAAAEAFGR
jgi:hypothetical protein